MDGWIHRSTLFSFSGVRTTPHTCTPSCFFVSIGTYAEVSEAGEVGTRPVIVGRSDAGLFPQRLRLRSVNGLARIADGPSIPSRFTNTIHEGNRFESHKVPVRYVSPVWFFSFVHRTPLNFFHYSSFPLDFVVLFP